MSKKTMISIGLLSFILIAFWQYQNIGSDKRFSKETVNLDGRIVQFETNKGNFEVSLSARLSPKTVNNFIQYVKSGFYNGTIFHRAIPGVIIQGGGFDSEMKEKFTRPPIKNEANNGLSNEKGSIAMARRTRANSATSQFFINLKDNVKLDYSETDAGYAVFGKVTKGLDLLIKLSKRKSISVGQYQNVPQDEIKLISVKLVNHSGLKEISNENNVNRSDVDKNDSLTEIKFIEGVHYQKLDTPILLTNSSKVEVVSAFSYGCGHCYGAYPQVDAWKKAHSKDISFSFFHAVWNPAMKFYAKTYYTAIELKIQKQSHIPLFEAIVINQETLSRKEELAVFFERFGVDKKQFIEIFDSQKIEKRVIQAEKLTQKFHLASVPEFIVAGKYRVDPMRAGGQNEMFELLDFLVNKEK